MTAPPREHRIGTPDGEICWFEWGIASEKPTLLLLHATGFHARLWNRVVARLPRDMHVVAPDHRGHGRSFRPELLSDWAANAAALLPLIDHLAGQPMIGCGHSMGGYVLSRLAADRPTAFAHLVLIDPVIMEPQLYRGASDHPVPDPADHPVGRHRNYWESADIMRDRFTERLPYSRWDREILDDYCRYGLLSAPEGEGFELACPPALEASMYQNALRTDPHAWLGELVAPVSLIRAPSGARSTAMDFSQSPTWTELGPALGAVRDELWAEHSHFIPMEAPARVAALLTDIMSA